MTEHNGQVFADTEESLERMERYRAFLALQNEADDLTDAEYLSRLDAITYGDREGFLDGAESYGTDLADGEYGTPGWVQDVPHEEYGADEYGEPEDEAAAEIPEPEAAVDDGWVYNGPITDEYGNLIDVDGEQASEEAEDGQATVQDGRGGGFADLRMMSRSEAQYDEYGPLDGLEDDLEDDDVPGGVTGPTEQDAPDGPQAGVPVIELDDEEPDGPEAGLGSGPVPDTPGPQSAPSVGPAPMLENEDAPGPQFTEPQYIKHESFEAHDALDELSLATGLAGYVETYEYIPPQEIQPNQPQTQQQPQPVSPAMAKLQRQIEAMDGPQAPQREATGPSGP